MQDGSLHPDAPVWKLEYFLKDTHGKLVATKMFMAEDTLQLFIEALKKLDADITAIKGDVADAA